MEWIDGTSYPRGNRGKKEPSVWIYRNNYLSILIVKGHIYYPNMWIMNCQAAGIRELDLHISGDQPKVVAQEKALTIVRSKLNNMVESLKS